MSESNPKHTRNDLFQMQSLPLDMKVKMTERRIREWYEYYGGEVAVSFSGGKDSTVLLHICRSIYPDMKAVYFNTGLEFPSLTKYVKKKYENVEICKPKYTFVHLIKKYGYPLISKEISQHLHDARGYIEKRKEELIKKSFELGGGYKKLRPLLCSCRERANLL